MRQYILFGIALTSLAMGGKSPEIPNNPTGPVPDTYEQKFRELAKTYGANLVGKTITFAFKSFFGSTIGMCRMNGSGRNSVDLSTSAWNKGSEAFREMLVFHELGHCLLGRGHKNTSHSDGRRESLMNSYIFDSRVYLAHRDEYLKELFTVVRDVAVRSLIGGIERERDQVFDGCQFGK